MYPFRLKSSFWKCLLASNISIGVTSQESSAGVEVVTGKICDCVGDDCDGDEEDRCDCDGRLDEDCETNKAGFENRS